MLLAFHRTPAASVGVLLLTACIGCVPVDRYPESPLRIAGGPLTAAIGKEGTRVEWDSRELQTEDNLPLTAFRSFRDLSLRAQGTAPGEGRLLIYVTGRGDTTGYAAVDVPLAAGEALPSRDLLQIAEVVAANGVSGREALARALRDAALGGGSGRYPEYHFALTFRWIPGTGAGGTVFPVDSFELSGRAAPVEALF